MADTKISAGADPGTLLATDKTPIARSGSTTAYAATIAELATYANGAYVPSYFGGSPSMDGTAAPGTSALVGRGDHVHPTDTSRYAASNPSGYQTAAQVTTTVQAAQRYLNYADNSGFSVNQRGYVSGTALAAGIYGHDRWKAGAGGCTYTFTASPPATTITITAGTLQQVIEGASVAGGNYMLSWTGTAQGRVGAGSYAASPVAVTGITAGANTTIEFNAGTLGAVKLEAGTVATPWVALPAQPELARCQRFYNAYSQVIIGSYNTTGQQIYTDLAFPIMRAAPTVAFASTSYANTSGFSVNGGAAGINHARLQVTVTATGNAYALSDVLLSADL